MSEKIQIKAYSPYHELQHHTEGAAGIDLPVTDGRTIGRGEVHIVKTGVWLEIPEGYVGEVVMRSSYAKKGLVVANAPGQVDSDYRGEVMILLGNIANTPVELVAGHRVAQILFKKTEQADIVMVDSLDKLSKTERGAGGIGSTGE